MVDAGHLVAETEGVQLRAIGAESVRLNNLRSGLDIGLMNAKHDFGLGDVQLLEGALRAGAVKQHGAHRSVGNQYGVLDPLFEICDVHRFGRPRCTPALEGGSLGSKGKPFEPIPTIRPARAAYGAESLSIR